MSTLKSLTFTAAPARADNSPAAARRNKLINSLEKQLSLAMDSKYQATRHKWQIGEDGIKRLVERPIRVRPWWRTNVDGKVVLFVRYGAKPLEFEKGKAAVVVGSLDNLVEVLTTLLAAARACELDTLLEKHGGPRRS